MFLDGIYKSYDEINVLHNFNMEIKDNEITCILGPSGCGKSTLLNVMAGIINPDKGSIKNNHKKIGYVFQEDRLLPWKTVFENIKIVNKIASDNKIQNLIDIVGLSNFENKYPNQLSGGMRQRCSIARAFNYECQMLLMDEPFKSLDYDLRINMVKSLIDIWHKWKNSIVFVTHEIDEALLLGNRVVVLTKNPCTVETVIKINTPQNLRSLDDRELFEVRSKLIKTLSKQQDKGTYKSA
ncbi:ABC transporter ATP-binding protein [Serpentinicella alkaliphila]|uniref:NitT/TauT family transport system ATP-binding protein n=1 Tax=Serpentinicella alkaliphila TaxID=1734049 RepID=A0A4R2T9N0_9FIRM|nr:ABC transporter ATP-binding protein [Serpentinicella alkaliphila]QUH24796.1 ABC transporter ATP-binding protein [Serpentinicella alkaliphila]TCP98975.1 NitT/TauT family transport system ATP-binding protein [Serpentinicella alkaliphila]